MLYFWDSLTILIVLINFINKDINGGSRLIFSWSELLDHNVLDHHYPINTNDQTWLLFCRVRLLSFPRSEPRDHKWSDLHRVDHKWSDLITTLQGISTSFTLIRITWSQLISTSPPGLAHDQTLSRRAKVKTLNKGRQKNWRWLRSDKSVDL